MLGYFLIDLFVICLYNTKTLIKYILILIKNKALYNYLSVINNYISTIKTKHNSN